MASLTKSMVLHILERDDLAIRFENFCVELFGTLDGVEYVTTSRTYDLGRDGKGLSLKGGRVPPIICCGTEADVVKKSGKDMDRILEFVKPTMLRFCFTDPTFTEYKGNQIEASARNKCPTLEVVRSAGAAQIAQLVVEHPDAFENHYASELANLRTALAVQGGDASRPELTGLRLALTTQFHDDAQQQRTDLIRNLILTALADGVDKTPRSLASAVSKVLHLPREVHEGWLQSELNDLHGHQLVGVADGAYIITQQGRDEVADRSGLGAQVLLDGQAAVRELIERLTGHPSGDTEFSAVWKILEDGIVTMFLTHGAEVVDSIASIAAGERVVQKQETLRSNISEIGNRIRCISGGGGRIKDVAQAIEDSFYERDSKAFGWLTRVAEVFLNLCSLGLDPRAQDQVVQRLQEIELILDTDLILSLLSSGEANHSAVIAVVEGWTKIEGTWLVSASALEEVAHHAWVSGVEFKKVENDLDKMTHGDALHLCDNVFVRGFRAEQERRGRKCSRREFQRYISAFRGQRDHDFSKIVELLKDFQIQVVAENLDDSKQAKELADHVYNERKVATGYMSVKALREKCDRDGRLAAALLRRRKEIKDDGKTATVVSTSGALRSAVEPILDDLGQPDPVMYTPAISWLLSQVPGVSLTSSTLRAVLLDAEFPVRLHPIERDALRVLYRSEQYELHYSRRGTLRSAMREEIRSRAAEAGIDKEELIRAVTCDTEEAAKQFSEIVAASVDQIAYSQSEREVLELKQRVAELEAELQRRQGGS